MLDEVVNQRHQGSEEEAGHDLAVFDSPPIVGAERKTAKRPWQSSDQIRDHKNIVPVMIVGRRDIGPSATCQGSENAHTCNNLGQGRIRACGKDVPQENKSEARSGSDGDEDLEKRSLGISITDRGGDRWKPLIGVAVVFILDNLVIMQQAAHDQCTQECGIREDSMCP